MAGAQFMPSTMYGLDPVSLAGKVANTNATIASTQATRQSMMERSQMMRLREEQANREREKYAREMPFQQEMMQAEQAKRQADIARAQAEVRDFTTKAQLESEFDQKALDAEVLQAKSYDNWQEQIDALDGVLRRNSRYSMIPAGKQFLSAVDKERNNLVVQRDKAMYAAIARTRQNEALASGERKAQILADSRKGAQDRADRKEQYNVAKDLYEIKRRDYSNWLKQEEQALSVVKDDKSKAEVEARLNEWKTKISQLDQSFEKQWSGQTGSMGAQPIKPAGVSDEEVSQAMQWLKENEQNPEMAEQVARLRSALGLKGAE